MQQKAIAELIMALDLSDQFSEAHAVLQAVNVEDISSFQFYEEKPENTNLVDPKRGGVDD